VTTDYKITEADVKGPFVSPLPRDLIEQAQTTTRTSTATPTAFARDKRYQRVT
jgi:hypothetical protein